MTCIVIVGLKMGGGGGKPSGSSSKSATLLGTIQTASDIRRQRPSVFICAGRIPGASQGTIQNPKTKGCTNIRSK